MGIYVFVVQMRWIAVRHRRVAWIGCGLCVVLDEGMGGIRF